MMKKLCTVGLVGLLLCVPMLAVSATIAHAQAGGAGGGGGGGKKRYGKFHEYLKGINYNGFNVLSGRGALLPSLIEKKGQGLNIGNLKHAAKGDKFRTGKGQPKGGGWVNPKAPKFTAPKAPKKQAPVKRKKK
jgi:hypothetical protein